MKVKDYISDNELLRKYKIFFKAQLYYYKCYEKHLNFYHKIRYILNNTDLRLNKKKDIIYYDQKSKKYFLNYNDPENIIKNKEIYYICSIKLYNYEEETKKLKTFETYDIKNNNKFTAKIIQYEKNNINIPYIINDETIFYYLMYISKIEKVIIVQNNNIKKMFFYTDE